MFPSRSIVVANALQSEPRFQPDARSEPISLPDYEDCLAYDD